MRTQDPKRRWEAWQVLAAVVVALVLLGLPVVMHLNREPLPPDERFPATLLGHPLRLQTSAGDRVLLLSEQRVRHWYWNNRGRFGGRKASEEQWQLVLWALDAGDGRVLWRRRLPDNGTAPMASTSDILTAEGDVLRLELREPLRVSALDGAVLPEPAGERLSVAGTDVHDAYGTVTRGLPVEESGSWFGLLSGDELQKLSADRQWTPEGLAALPRDAAMRLYRAKVDRVSAAPDHWPAGLGGNWGERNAYSDYRVLESAPLFQQAGLLIAKAQGPAMRMTAPDGALVLHRPGGEATSPLRLARVRGDTGAVLWDIALPQQRLSHVMPGERTLVLAGPGPRMAPEATPTLRISVISLDGGASRDFDLGAASRAPPDAP